MMKEKFLHSVTTEWGSLAFVPPPFCHDWRAIKWGEGDSTAKVDVVDIRFLVYLLPVSSFFLIKFFSFASVRCIFVLN